MWNKTMSILFLFYNWQTWREAFFFVVIIFHYKFIPLALIFWTKTQHKISSSRRKHLRAERWVFYLRISKLLAFPFRDWLNSFFSRIYGGVGKDWKLAISISFLVHMQLWGTVQWKPAERSSVFFNGNILSNFSTMS